MNDPRIDNPCFTLCDQKCAAFTQSTDNPCPYCNLGVIGACPRQRETPASRVLSRIAEILRDSGKTGNDLVDALQREMDAMNSPAHTQNADIPAACPTPAEFTLLDTFESAELNRYACPAPDGSPAAGCAGDCGGCGVKYAAKVEVK